VTCPQLICHPGSDVDLAIEMLSPMEDGEALAHWSRFHKGWDGFLSRELGLAVRIELYRGPQFTPAVHAALEQSSEVVYESAPPPRYPRGGARAITRAATARSRAR
jgi:hypothetical protein